LDIKLQLNKGHFQPRLERITEPLKALLSLPIKHHKASNNEAYRAI